MKCSLPIFTIFLTILFTFILPTEIGCCSDNILDFTMSKDTNYQRDPCYIKLKAAQDAKLKQIWREIQGLEEISKQNDPIMPENEEIKRIEKISKQNNPNVYGNAVREQENRYNSYRTTKVVKMKGREVFMIFGITSGAIVGVFCCLAFCSYIKSEANLTVRATPNTIQPDRNPDLIVSSMETRQSALPSRESTPQYRHTAGPRQLTEADAQLLPRDVINRQNSLPTYEDAMTMPSAPPEA